MPDARQSWRGMLRVALSVVFIAALVSCSDAAGPSEPGRDQVALVDVEPELPVLQPGDTARLRATPRTQNGTVLHGRAVTWTSGDSLIAAVTTAGLVTARRAGSVTIFATIEGRTGSARIEIEAAAPQVETVQVLPDTVTAAPGTVVQFAALALDAEGRPLDIEIVWSSSAEDVAQVSATGLVLAGSPGIAAIHADAAGRRGTGVVIVPAPPPVVSRVEPAGDGVVTLYTGDTRLLAVRAFSASGDEIPGRPVSWESDSPDIAMVSAAGVVTARAVGSALVTATVDGLSARIGIDVRSLVTRVELDPPAAAVPVGDEVRFRAVARSASGEPLQRPVEFTSTNAAVASIDENGLVTARAPGTATIIATVEGQQGWAEIRVAEWISRDLSAVDGAELPATLSTRTWNDSTGTHVTTVIAQSGSFRTAETGMHTGRYEQRFLVWIRTDDNVPQVGEYVLRGDYTFDFVNRRFSLRSWSNQVLAGELLDNGGVRVTGRLEANAPELVFLYAPR